MSQVSPARMYDALLGGSHNFEIDRRAAEMGKALVPDLPRVALSNRAFLRRSVRFLVDAGVRQFLDIGSGIPTAGNVHEVAQEIDPEIRVLYVDIDPVAVAHSRAILAGNERATAVEADLRKPADLLTQVRATGLLDFEQPVGVLLFAVLHLLGDDDHPGAAVRSVYEAVPSGSYVAISHLTSSTRPEDAAALGTNSAEQNKIGIHFRTQEAITGLFGDWQLIEPGVVELPTWRPEPGESESENGARSLGLAGVGRKA